MHRSLILDNAHLSSHTAWPYSKRSGRSGFLAGPDHFRLEFEGVVIFSERARAAVYYLTRPAALRMRTLHRINHTYFLAWAWLIYTSDTPHRLPPVATWPSNPYSTHTRL